MTIYSKSTSEKRKQAQPANMWEEHMEYDCGFKKGDNRFRYRTGGILIHDNKMLFVKSNFGDYYMQDYARFFVQFLIGASY